MAEQSTDLCEYSTQELVDELSKRDGVWSHHFPTDYFLTVGRKDSSTVKYRQGGEATILVVKEE